MSIYLISPPFPTTPCPPAFQTLTRTEEGQRLGVNLLFLFSQGVFFLPATCFQCPYLDSKERAWIC